MFLGFSFIKQKKNVLNGRKYIELIKSKKIFFLRQKSVIFSVLYDTLT